MAAWRADESGATRMDRAVLVFGVIAVMALLAFSLTGRDDPASLVEAGNTPAAGSAVGPGQAAPERRVVSAAGQAAPEPPALEGEPVGPAHTSPSYMQRFEPRFDNEQAILDAQTERAVAVEEAARAAAAEAAPADAAPQDEPAEATDGS